MENFSLWNARADSSKTSVTFFATSAGFQRINRGTSKMVAEMLNDLGVPSDRVKDWSVLPFATDYLSDDLNTDDWRDRWLTSYEVTVRMSGPIAFKAPSKYLIESLAADKTWTGDEPAPQWCTVVADFPSESERPRFEQAVTGRSPDLKVEQSRAHDRQTLVSIPAGEAFFKGGAKLALSIEHLAREFGGTTHWRDRFGDKR